jgi:hypothetical protein
MKTSTVCYLGSEAGPCNLVLKGIKIMLRPGEGRKKAGEGELAKESLRRLALTPYAHSVTAAK